MSVFDPVWTKLQVVGGAEPFEHVLVDIGTLHEALDAVVRRVLDHLLQNTQVFVTLESCVRF